MFTLDNFTFPEPDINNNVIPPFTKLNPTGLRPGPSISQQPTATPEPQKKPTDNFVEREFPEIRYGQ